MQLAFLPLFRLPAKEKEGKHKQNHVLKEYAASIASHKS